MSSHSQALNQGSNSQQDHRMSSYRNKAGPFEVAVYPLQKGRQERDREQSKLWLLDWGQVWEQLPWNKVVIFFFDGGNTSPLPALKCEHAATFEQLAWWSTTLWIQTRQYKSVKSRSSQPIGRSSMIRLDSSQFKQNASFAARLALSFLMSLLQRTSALLKLGRWCTWASYRPMHGMRMLLCALLSRPTRRRWRKSFCKQQEE